MPEPTIVQFQVGKTYSCRSLGDHNCIWTFTVHARTAKFITIDAWPETGKTKRVGVNVYDGAEYAYPIGQYSLAPSIRADRADQDLLEAGLPVG